MPIEKYYFITKNIPIPPKRRHVKLRNSKSKLEHMKDSLWDHLGLDAIRYSEFVKYASANLLIHIGAFGMIIYMPLVAKDKNISQETVAHIMFISGLGELVLRPMSGWITDALLKKMERKYFSFLG